MPLSGVATTEQAPGCGPLAWHVARHGAGHEWKGQGMAITSMVAGQINEVQRTVEALRDVCAGIPGLAEALRDADAALDRAFILAEYGDDEEV